MHWFLFICIGICLYALVFVYVHCFLFMCILFGCMHCSTSPLKVLTRTVYAFLHLVNVAVRGLRRIQRKYTKDFKYKHNPYTYIIYNLYIYKNGSKSSCYHIIIADRKIWNLLSINQSN